MLRKILKKKKIRLKFKKLVFYYFNIKFKFYNKVDILNLYNCCFFLTLPKRQQIFTFYSLKNFKFFSFSTGFFFGKLKTKAKFYKRSSKNIAGLVMNFKKKYSYYLKYIYLFYIKNYNYRQYLFFYKLLNILKPTIEYFIHKQSYLPRFLKKRRIKRKVLRLLAKK